MCDVWRVMCDVLYVAAEEEGDVMYHTVLCVMCCV